MKKQLQEEKVSFEHLELRKRTFFAEKETFIWEGKGVDERGNDKLTKISLTREGQIQWECKVAEKDKRLGGLKEEVLMKFNIELGQEGNIKKVRDFEVRGDYLDQMNPQLLEGKMKELLKDELIIKWVGEQMDRYGLKRLPSIQR